VVEMEFDFSIASFTKGYQALQCAVSMVVWGEKPGSLGKYTGSVSMAVCQGREKLLQLSHTGTFQIG